MRLRLAGENPNAFRAFVAAVLLSSVVLTIGLAAIPQLHDWLHKTTDPQHECAATQLSSSGWEHVGCGPIFTAPEPIPVRPTFVIPGVRVIARAGFSILEHAPPVRS